MTVLIVACAVMLCCFFAVLLWLRHLHRQPLQALDVQLSAVDQSMSGIDGQQPIDAAPTDVQHDVGPGTSPLPRPRASLDDRVAAQQPAPTLRIELSPN
jgi:hypothetical protein